MRYHFPTFVKISLMLLVQRIKTQKWRSSETTAETPYSGFQLSKLTKQASHFSLAPWSCFKLHRISEAKILPIPHFHCQKIQHVTTEADRKKTQTTGKLIKHQQENVLIHQISW